MGRERVLEIVVAAIIVLIVLAILVPTRHGNPPASPESAAVANLRTINTAEFTYKSSSGGGTYGSRTDLIDAGLLDDTFTGTKAGYSYTITLNATGTAYTAETVPAAVVPKWYSWFSSSPASTKTGGRFAYYSLPDQVVRYSTDSTLAPAGQSGRSVQ